MATGEPSVRAGRRPATSRAHISHVGLELFARNGFDETGVDELAAAAGISRRTLFRYFDSKNDVPWGDFDAQLLRMRRFLADLPPGTALAQGLLRALVDFNTFPPQESGYHRQRMALLLGVPALQAHSALMYTGWRRVVAEHVATATGADPDDHGPRTAAWVLLGVALSAYEQWLAHDDADLLELLRSGGQVLLSGMPRGLVGSPSDEQP